MMNLWKKAPIVLLASTALAAPALAQSTNTQCVTSALAGGTGNAITVPLLPCATATNILILTLSASNTESDVTLQMPGYPALPVLQSTGDALEVGQLEAGATAYLTGTGKSWLLMSNPVGPTGPQGPTGAQGPAGPAGSVDAASSLKITGSSSGTVTVQPQADAGTYNFNLPTSAGTAGDALVSGGGAAAPMSWAPFVTTVDSMAELDAMTAAQMAFAGTISMTGYYAGSTLGGGIFRWLTAAQADGLSPDGGIIIAPSDHTADCTDGCLARQLSGPPSVTFWGAKLDDSHDDTAAFNSAISYVTGTGEFGYISAPAGAAKLSSGLTLDPTHIGMQCDGTTLDFTSLSSGDAITIAHDTGSGSDTYTNQRSVMYGCGIKGSGNANGVVGIYAGGSKDTAHYAIENGYVTGFEVGFENNENSYTGSFIHFDLWGNGTGVQIDNATNSGENISFTSSSVFNNNINLDMENPNSEIVFNGGSSIDFGAQKQINLVAGLFTGTGTNIEGDNVSYLDVPSNSNQVAKFTCTGCYFTQHQASTNPAFNVVGAAQVALFGGIVNPDPDTTVLFNGSSAYDDLSVFGTDVGNPANLTSEYTGTWGQINWQPVGTNAVNPNGLVTVSVSALSTWTDFSIPGAAPGGDIPLGLYLIRDMTNGGSALFLAQSTGVTKISGSDNINYQFQQVEITSGTVPATLLIQFGLGTGSTS